ncbi:MAG: hypothetical protein NXI32_16305 [bacterium]|nr:hypothetical protein [bacterium]
MRLVRLAGVLIFSLCALLSHQARADIIVILQATPGSGGGTFSLFLQDNLAGSTLGSFGIASYSIPLVSSGTFTFDHVSPRDIASNGQNVGFTLLRTADNNSTATSSAVISASQETVIPNAYRVSNFGISAGSLADHIDGNSLLGIPNLSDQPNYGVPLLIATGEYSGAAPRVDFQSIDLGGNVFTTSELTSTRGATFVPEPSAGMLCTCLLSLAYLRRRRRMR